jgi:hypothetical protein
LQRLIKTLHDRPDLLAAARHKFRFFIGSDRIEDIAIDLATFYLTDDGPWDVREYARAVTRTIADLEKINQILLKEKERCLLKTVLGPRSGLPGKTRRST